MIRANISCYDMSLWSTGIGVANQSVASVVHERVASFARRVVVVDRTLGAGTIDD